MKKKLILIFIVVCVVFLGISAFRTDLKTVQYEVETPKVKEEIRLALVSDLHSCQYDENQQMVIDEIEKFNPHGVLFGGDIIDDVIPETNAWVLLERVAETYPTFYVSGNHEWWSGKMTEHFRHIRTLGINVLRGDCIPLKVGETTVNICGVDDPEVVKYNPGESIEKQLEHAAEIKSEDFSVLVAHRPERAEQYFEHGFDMALCGHAHGGQFRVPFLMNGFYAPDQGFFPKLAGGKYDFDGKTLIVGRGLSKENTKLPRIFNRPELVMITIKPE